MYMLPKMVFRINFLRSDLENYASRKANAMYAWVGNFRAITM
jgi:hypothetical protein